MQAGVHRHVWGLGHLLPSTNMEAQKEPTKAFLKRIIEVACNLGGFRFLCCSLLRKRGVYRLVSKIRVPFWHPQTLKGPQFWNDP